jgi:hypothetical protein
MTIYNPEGTHSKYTQVNRHWCAHSEAYTGADSLLTAQRNGWQLAGLVYQQNVLFPNGRHTTLYHFELVRGSEKVLMPVLRNPFVERLIQQQAVDILPYRHLPQAYPALQVVGA